jgi:hypothetical protein
VVNNSSTNQSVEEGGMSWLHKQTSLLCFHGCEKENNYGKAKLNFQRYIKLSIRTVMSATVRKILIYKV